LDRRYLRSKSEDEFEDDFGVALHDNLRIRVKRFHFTSNYQISRCWDNRGNCDLFVSSLGGNYRCLANACRLRRLQRRYKRSCRHTPGGLADSIQPEFSLYRNVGAGLEGFNNMIGSLAGNGVVTNRGAASARLTIGYDNTNTTFSGTLVDGTSALRLAKIGTGTLTLTGNNTYSGGTRISGGFLQIGNGGTTGSISGDVTNNGWLVFGRSDNVTFDGKSSKSSLEPVLQSTAGNHWGVWATGFGDFVNVDADRNAPGYNLP